MVKYAVVVVVFILVVIGAYWVGFVRGLDNARIEYVTEKVEVIKYVDREKAKIYTAPNASTGVLIELFNNGKL